jgi:hypothetical protein
MLSTPSNPSLVGFAVGEPSPPEPALVSSPALASSKRQKFVRRQFAVKLVHYIIISSRTASRTLFPAFAKMAPQDCMAGNVRAAQIAGPFLQPRTMALRRQN